MKKRMFDQKSKFGIVDYVVLVASLIICLGIGAYYGRKNKTGNLIEFALANRKVSIIPAAFSIFATVYSGNGLTTLVGEMYMYGSGFFVFGTFYTFSGLFMAYAIVPVFFKISYVSVYEYIERRFDGRLRTAYVVLYIIQQLTYMSVIMYVPAISLSAFADIPYWISVSIFSGVCIIYSTVGGMMAVIRTDLIQAILMFVCMLLIIFKGSHDVGGFKKVWEFGVQGNRIGNLSLLENSENRYSFWAVLFSGLVASFSYMTTNQAVMQRVLSVKGLKEAQKSVVLGLFLQWIFIIGVSIMAVTLYANYRDCDPTLVTEISGIKTEDEIVVYYISTVLSQYPGVAGLAISGIMSGSLSSLSSFLNTFATITVHDLITPNLSAPLEEKQLNILCKCLTLFCGIFCLSLSMAIPYIGRATPIILTIFGVFGGPLAGVFFMGMFIKRANIKGALIGLIVAVIFGMWLAIGNKLSHYEPNKLSLSIKGCEGNVTKFSMFQNITNTQENIFPLYKISFVWYLPIGFFISIAIGILISFSTKIENTDPSLLSPMVSKGHRPRINESAKDTMVETELLNSTDLSI